MRFILDTNIIVSALLVPNSAAIKAINDIIKNYEILISEETLEEFAYVIQKEKFLKYVNRDVLADFFDDYKSVAKKIAIIYKIDLCRDPKDNKFLELAVNGKADYIITGDNDLLVLHPFGDTKIITARDYLEEL